MKYRDKILEEKIGNIDLRIVGVHHTKEFFLENKVYLKKEIDKAEHLFFEDGLNCGNYFYQNLAEFANKKSIYVPDSSTLGQLFHDVLLTGVGLKLIQKFIKNFSEGPKSLSRKKFLKNMGLGFAGLCLGKTTFGDLLINEHTPSHEILDDKLAFNIIIDFRNIISAENFLRAEKDLNIRGKCTYFIGEGHLNGLSVYLNNPNLTKKRVLYLPQELFVDSRIKEYKKIDKNWQIVKNF